MPAFLRISLLLLTACVWMSPAWTAAAPARPLVGTGGAMPAPLDAQTVHAARTVQEPGTGQEAQPGRAMRTAHAVRTVQAMQTVPEAQIVQARDSVHVSLLTILPGDDIYSLWGHSAIRIAVPAFGVDRSYNYGTFSFETDFFVARFLHGSLDYMLSLQDFDAAMRHYRAEGRPVIEQVLELSPGQKDALIRYLDVNLRPENRTYRYHFLFDNCSTRVRDAFEIALDGALRFSDEPDPGLTFRQMIDPYQSEVPLLDLGIDWLLGVPVDRVAQPFETMFLPDYLMQAFDRAHVERAGVSHPLVNRTDTLLWIDGYDSPGGSFPWGVLVGWSLFALGVVVSYRSWRSDHEAGIVRSVDAPLFVVVGLAGVLITYLWFVSHHDVTEMNWHLLWAWPTHLLAGVAIVIRRGRFPRWLTSYVIASGVMAAAAFATLPFWPQSFNAALLPVALLVALRGGAVLQSQRRRRSMA